MYLKISLCSFFSICLGVGNKLLKSCALDNTNEFSIIALPLRDNFLLESILI